MVPKISKPPASTGGRDTESCCVPHSELGGVAEDQHQRVGEQQLVELLAAVEIAEQQALDERAEERHAERRGEHRRPEPAPGTGCSHCTDLPGEIGADHVERAVREIEHAHDAEHQRQARGDQEQEHRRGEPAHELAEQE